jgi:hypothetical protein
LKFFQLKTVSKYAFERSPHLEPVTISISTVIGNDPVSPWFGVCPEFVRYDESLEFSNTTVSPVQTHSWYVRVDQESITKLPCPPELLFSVNFPLNCRLKQIKTRAFVIPDSVEEIQSCGFLGCARLRIIEFGEDSRLKTIGDNAFIEASIEANLFSQ